MPVGSHGLQPGDHHAGDADHGHDQNGDGDHLQRQYALHWPMPKKDQSLNLKLGTLEGLQGILSISHSVSNTPLIILQTLLIFNLTLKRSNHIKLMGDHMANETGSFCLPNARMCVSLSPR